MASTVGGLDSIDLLDLLFDRQDGILRGVELGTTSPGTWHEDGVRSALPEPHAVLSCGPGRSYRSSALTVTGIRIPTACPGWRGLP